MKNSTSFTILIPARLQSSRLPRKPLAEISGLPMIVRVAKQALKSQAKKVIIATDSNEIAKVCDEYRLPVVITDKNHQSGTDRLAEATQKLGLANSEIVLNIQGDEPLINPELINQLAARLAMCDAPMATLAHPIFSASEYENPNVVKVVLNHKQEAMYFSRSVIPFLRNVSPKLPIYRHIGLYAYRADFLKKYHQLEPALIEQTESLEQLRILWHGYAINVLISNEETSIGVDTQQDLDRVIELMKNQK